MFRYIILLCILLFVLVSFLVNSEVYSSTSGLTMDWGGKVNNMSLVSKKDQDINILTVSPYLDGIISSNCTFFISGKFMQLHPFSPPIDAPYDNKQIYDLESAYLSGDLNPHISLNIGRKNYKLGSGFLFNNTSDGIDLDMSYGNFKGLFLANYTGLQLKETNPYNFNRNDFIPTNDVEDRKVKLGGAKRIFGGMSPGLYFGEQYLYILALYQHDLADDSSERYTTYYGGLGLKGSFLNDFGYSIDGVYEGGSSPNINYEQNGRDKINAYGSVANLSYIPKSKSNFQIITTYAIGSGDANRETVNLSKGNMYGKDAMFKTFGTYPRGSIVRPELTNLQIASITIAFNPLSFSKSRTFKKFQFGLRSYSYFKLEKEAPIGGFFGVSNSFSSSQYTSIPENKQDKYLGSTGETFIKWEVTSDLYVGIDYGIFFQNFKYYKDAPTAGTTVDTTKKTQLFMGTLTVNF